VVSSLLRRVGLHAGTPLPTTQDAILVEWRLPRVLLAALVGGVLALAGASYQGVFRNPLADPYLLGAAAGAGLGATIIIGWGPDHFGPLGTVPAAAFVGALTGVGLAYGLGTIAARQGGGTATLVLAGVAVSAFLTAAQTLAQQAHAEDLRQVYSWILGRLGTAQWDDVFMALPYAAVSALVLLFSGRALDVLAVGDDEATTLGVRPGRLRLIVLLAASLGTAAAVAVSGLIGFVGLVVPHVVRRLAGGSYRTVLPVSLVGGAAFMVGADLVARTVLAPAELPIGVVTAFVGAPFFAVLLRTTGGGSS
jgi:iron complex transport system permease protein